MLSSHKHCIEQNLLSIVMLQDGKEGLLGSKEASTGVYVGCVWQEYQVLLEHLRVTPTVAVLTGSGMNFMIGRVSYTLGLQGLLQTSVLLCLHASGAATTASSQCTSSTTSCDHVVIKS